MINYPSVVRPSASTLGTGAVLWVLGSLVAQVGGLAGLGWVIVGGLTALVGMVVGVTGLYRLAVNVDLAAHTALRTLREVSALAAAAGGTGPRPPEAAVPPPADGQGGSAPVSPAAAPVADQAPTEGIASQLARLRALHDAGTLTSEELDAMTAAALKTWSAQNRGS